MESRIRGSCEARANVEIFNISTPQQMEQALRDAASKRYDLVVAAGGDGTVSAVASAVVAGGSVLGVLPVGTLNHFAKDMGIPLEVDAALKTLLTGHIVSVDVGEVNGRTFVNNSSLGLYPKLVLLREKEQERGLSKWVALAKAALVALKRHPFMTVTVHTEGKQVQRRTSFIFIGNNVYDMSGVDAGTRASLTEHTLSVYISHKQTRLGLLGLVCKALLGLLDYARDLDYLTPAEITIQTHRKSVDVAMDGEVVRLETPLHYRIRPKALNVMVPRSAEG